jgi:Spy/CpxP family protein refolding chaperone
MENVNLIRKATVWFSLLAIFVVAPSLWAQDDMKGKQGEMGAMAPAAAPSNAMGMCCMGEMGMPPGGNAGMGATTPSQGMARMAGPSSAMPGQPGASHLLHMGSTGFFLNHSQHITLTADQKSKLNRLKENAMLGQASEQRRIDQAEQELYTFTGADEPDNARIQAKLGEIEKLRAEQRMKFIRAVGEASNVLTHDQHLALLGNMPASKK